MLKVQFIKNERGLFFYNEENIGDLWWGKSLNF